MRARCSTGSKPRSAATGCHARDHRDADDATAAKSVRGYIARSTPTPPASHVAADPEAIDLVYETIDWRRPKATG